MADKKVHSKRRVQAIVEDINYARAIDFMTKNASVLYPQGVTNESALVNYLMRQAGAGKVKVD